MEKIKRQSGDVRRMQIKSAVKKILFYEGMQKLTTKNIALEVGISEGTVFKHYTSKKAILDDILNDVKRLEKHICFHLDYLTKNKGITILLFTEASYQNDTALKKMLDKIYQSMEQSFGNIIRDGIAEGIWDEKVSIEDLSSLYMGIPLAMNIELLLHQGDIRGLNFCKNMLDLLKRILRK